MYRIDKKLEGINLNERKSFKMNNYAKIIFTLI